MPTVKETLGRRVIYLRNLRKWTQEQLGEKAGLTYKYIGQIERAEVSPSLETLEKLAKAFGVSISQLLDFGRTGSGKSKEELFERLSKREIELLKKAAEVLKRVFD